MVGSGVPPHSLSLFPTMTIRYLHPILVPDCQLAKSDIDFVELEYPALGAKER